MEACHNSFKYLIKMEQKDQQELQLVETFAAKHYDVSPIPRTYILVGESLPLQVVL